MKINEFILKRMEQLELQEKANWWDMLMWFSILFILIIGGINSSTVLLMAVIVIIIQFSEASEFRKIKNEYKRNLSK